MAVLFRSPISPIRAIPMCLWLVGVGLTGCGWMHEVNNPPAGWLQGDASLVEARFLLPLTDRAGRPFPPDRIAWVESELVRRYGSFVHEGDIERESKAPYIAPVREQVRRYLLTLRRDQETDLRNFLKRVKEAFGEREIYLTLDRDRGEWI